MDRRGCSCPEPLRCPTTMPSAPPERHTDQALQVDGLVTLARKLMQHRCLPDARASAQNHHRAWRWGFRIAHCALAPSPEATVAAVEHLHLRHARGKALPLPLRPPRARAAPPRPVLGVNRPQTRRARAARRRSPSACRLASNRAAHAAPARRRGGPLSPGWLSASAPRASARRGLRRGGPCACRQCQPRRARHR